MKRISLSALLLIVLGTIHAQNVSSDAAFSKALQFLEGKRASNSKGTAGHVKASDIHSVSTATLNVSDEMYIFNVSADGGYVIVSGDERTPAILGYADNGSINPADMPENMQSWLMGYAEEIRLMRLNNSHATTAAIATHPAISPMIAARWDQGSPYNASCPVLDGKRCYTGCVATAMAQVLYYIQPAGSTAISAYEYEKGTVPGLNATTFNWSIMRPTFNNTDADTGAAEVAKLMRYCGQSVEMKYGTGSSGTPTAKALRGFIKNFGISPSARILNRLYYSSTDWDNLLYAELKGNRPMVFSGQNVGGGHAFVCDGYDGNGMYHINWGWSGKSNGYFLLSNLNPDDQGVGGTTGGYNSEMYAITGLKLKEACETPDNRLTASGLLDYSPKVTRTSKDSYFSVTMVVQIVNYSNVEDYILSYALFDSQNNMVSIADGSEGNFPNSTTMGMRYTTVLGKGIGDGTYTLKPVCKEMGSDTWHELIDAEFNSLNFIIKGNEAELKSAIDTTPSYTASDFSMSGNGVTGNPQQLTVTLTNNANIYSSDIYVFVDGELVDYFTADIDPGDTKTLNASITFKDNGNHTVMLCAADAYIFIPITNSIIYTTTAEEVCDMSYNTVLVTPSTMKGDIYQVNGDNCEVSVTYTNYTSKNYNSVVGFFLGWMTSQYGFTYNTTPATVPVSIPAGESVTVTYTYTGLESGTTYLLAPSYKLDSSTWQYPWNDALRVKCNQTTGIHEASTIVVPFSPEYHIDGKATNGTQQHGIVIRNGRKYIEVKR